MMGARDKKKPLSSEEMSKIVRVFLEFIFFAWQMKS